MHGDRRNSVSRRETIASAANPSIKYARSLQRRRIRQKERAILVEGVRAILTAAAHDVRIRTLFVDASRDSSIDAETLSLLTSHAERTQWITPELLRLIAETEQPQPLVAICDMPHHPVPSDSSLIVAIDGIRDPGNLGTLVRSAAAAGADGVVLLPQTVDLFNPKVIRASMGSVFVIPTEHMRSIADLVSTKFVLPPQIAAAESGGDVVYDAVDWTQPSVIVIGGEASGVSDEVRTYANIRVSIPIDPNVESLNAAVAGSVILFEANRQRRSRH